MKQIFVIIAFMCISSLFSQTIKDVNQNQKGEQHALDKVDIQCLYKYYQTAKKGAETIVFVDSMLLELGQDCSLYYDWKRAFSTNKSAPKTGLSAINPKDIKSVSVLKDQTQFESMVGNSMAEVFENTAPRENLLLYKKRGLNELIIIEKAGKYNYKCEEKISHDWEIFEETQQILSYTCQKATTSFRGRNYTVWFASEIPVSDGPWKLYGLPGLILKAEDSEQLFRFEAIGLEQSKEDKYITIEDKEYIKVDSKQLDKNRQKRLSKITLYSANNGNVLVSEKTDPTIYIKIEKD